jgi:hypothetical protein
MPHAGFGRVNACGMREEPQMVGVYKPAQFQIVEKSGEVFGKPFRGKLEVNPGDGVLRPVVWWGEAQILFDEVDRGFVESRFVQGAEISVTMNGKRAKAHCVAVGFYYNLLRFELTSHVPFVSADGEQ